MNSENWQEIISSIENTRIIFVEYNCDTGKTKSAYIKRINEENYVLAINDKAVGFFESEQAAFYYWETEFDCKVVEPIEGLTKEKKSFWARIFKNLNKFI